MDLEALKRDYELWRARYAARAKDRPDLFDTMSGTPVEPLYTPLDLAASTTVGTSVFPASTPSPAASTTTCTADAAGRMRQFSGFGGAEETNARYHFLLEHGQTGLSVAFDFPTLMGYDSDHPRSRGEVGTCGVAIDSLADMETLFDGIPLDKVSTSMTINGPACTLLALYIAAAEKQGVSPAAAARHRPERHPEGVHGAARLVLPDRARLRLIVDMMEYCLASTCRSGTRSRSPATTSARRARTAAQELAFTLANGFTYVEQGIQRGLDVDEFAPRLSFFWDVHLDFFEEIAKFRAAPPHLGPGHEGALRRHPPRGPAAAHPRPDGRGDPDRPAAGEQHRAHRHRGAGRGARRHPVPAHQLDGRDAGRCRPTRRCRSPCAPSRSSPTSTTWRHTVDPLGGSYYVEALTNRLEKEAYDYFERIQKIGGVVKGIENGWFQREIQTAARRVSGRDRGAGSGSSSGVNDYVDPEREARDPAAVHRSGSSERPQEEQVAQAARPRATRAGRQGAGLARGAAESDENVMPALIECARSYVHPRRDDRR